MYLSQPDFGGIHVENHVGCLKIPRKKRELSVIPDLGHVGNNQMQEVLACGLLYLS